MPNSQECQVLNSADEQANLEERIYKMNVREAIAQTFGLPKAGNKDQKELYRIIYNHLMDVGARTAYTMAPEDKMAIIAAEVQRTTSRGYRGMQYENKNRTRSLLRMMKRTMKKMNKYLKQDKIGHLDHAWGDVFRIAFEADKTGKGYKLFEMSANIMANIQGMIAPIVRREEAIYAGKTGIKDAVLKQITKENIKDWILPDGIEHDRIKIDNNYVRIMDYTKGTKGSPDMFTIKYTSGTKKGTTEKISQDDSGIDYIDFQDAVAESYIKFAKKILRKEVMYVIPRAYGHQKDEIIAVREIIKEIGDINKTFKESGEQMGASHKIQNINGEYKGQKARLSYITIKNKETLGVEEEYNAYAIAIEIGDNKINLLKAENVKLNTEDIFSGFFQEGFMEAEEDGLFEIFTGPKWAGKKYKANKDAMAFADPIQKAEFEAEAERAKEQFFITEKRAWTKYKPIESPRKKIPVEAIGLWEHVYDMRTLRKEIYDKTRELIEYNNNLLEETLKKMGYKSDEEGLKQIADILGLDANEMHVWLDKEKAQVPVLDNQGNIMEDPDTGLTLMEIKEEIVGIKTPDTIFSKQDNYDTIMFDKHVYWDMLDAAIINAEEKRDASEKNLNLQQIRLAKGKATDDDVGYAELIYEKRTEALEALKASRAGNVDVSEDPQAMKLQRDLTKSVFTKHRKSFTDRKRARNDLNVFSEYTNRLYRSIYTNQLIIRTLELSHYVKNPAAFDWYVGRVKLALGDINTDTEFLGMSTSFKTWAPIISSVLKPFRLLRNGLSSEKGLLKRTILDLEPVEPEKLRRWTYFVNAITSTKFLGMHAAMVNGTQRLNLIVDFGFKYMHQAWRLAKDPVWKKRVQDAGVLNILDAFHDMLSGGSGGSSDFKSFAPMSIGRFILIKNLSKREFISQVQNKKIDFIERILSDLGIRDFASAEKIKEWADAYWEIVLNRTETVGTEKQQKVTVEEKALLKKRINILTNKLSEDQVKNMVMWKLEWMPKFMEEGKSFLTFTGVEEKMRIEAAIVSMLVHDELGMLKAKEGEDKYATPLAHDIMRIGVLNTMFGMSGHFLGGFMQGVGRAFFQYKHYPHQQMTKDFHKMRSFWEGSEGEGSGSRSMNSAYRLIATLKNPINKITFGKIGKHNKYSIANTKFDHDSLSVLRVMFWRCLVSVLTASMITAPVVGDAVRMLRAGRISGFARGAENPFMGAATRIALYALMFGDEGDWEEDGLWQLRKFLIPPILSLMLDTLISPFLDD